MKKNLIMFFCLFFVKNSFSQKTISVYGILNSVYELDKSFIDKKLESYRYIIVKNGKIYNIDHYLNKNNYLDQIHTTNFMFLSDSTISQFSDEITDKELASFFNKEENKKLLLDDILIDFSNEIKYANVIHLQENNGLISDAHLYTYQFYDKNSFNQYGLGETPGQPQIGYIYRLATNVPKEVMKEIQKIDSKKFITIKANKSHIFKNAQLKTKLYLIKGDIIEHLETKNDWLKIRYYGKKTIEGWIKKSDVE